MKRIVIIGASGHGKVIADIADKNGYEEILFLDDDPSASKCGKHSVVGKSSDAENIDADFIVGIGNAAVREKLQTILEVMNKNIVTLIHPNAVIAEDVIIGKGTVIMAGAVINPGSTIGNGCIINTCASVDHDCIVEDYVHISVGSHLCGTVNIGHATWIGAGATVINNIDIKGNCMIGAGAVVVNNIEISGTYIGVPAMKMEDKLNLNNKFIQGGV